MPALRSKSCRRRLAAALVLACGVGLMPMAAAHDHHDHPASQNQAGTPPVVPQGARITLADVALLDQDGRSLRLRSDVLGERIVIVNFAYTTCTTVCPVTSAVLAQVQGRLGARLGRDIGLITVSVDPLRDTPARLKAYAERVGAGPGWRWITGAKPQVDEALKSFGAYTANFADHPPLTLVGDAKTGQWLRFYGFPSPDQLVAAVDQLSSARDKAGPRDAASYFTELELLTQDGRKVRFHSDVLQGRTVLINVVYASCQDACPLITQKLNEVRRLLPPELFGQQVFFVSLTSDPAHDTPQALKAFARKQGADVEGWTFLTGRKENVEHILKKLGQYSETVEGHSTLLIAGNVPAKRWSKIRPDAPPAAIAERLAVLATGAGVEAVRP